MRDKAGFTLIEIMVSLVLVGLIAAISGTSVITATRSYLFAKENNAITQKAQLALGRLNREFIELSDIKDANSTCVVYESPYGRRAVAKVGSAVHFFSDYATTTCPSTGGDILVDGVQTFSVMFNPSSGVSLWSLGQDIRNLFAVSVQLALARPDTGGAVSFFTTVSPRNNNNSGGAALPSASNPPPEYSGKQCFVTTAAYGDADHPVVEVLRQFRDRVLLPTTAGKALVRYYYEVGPSLAAAIEDKPIACLVVRLLVTPLAGFALLSLSCPVLIPLILLLSWGLARLILQILKRKSRRLASHLQGQRGAMLVTLIAAMVVFSALGAVMIGMFGTSALSQASGSNSQRAYYLAESGFRYASSRYIAVDLGSETANEAERLRLIRDDLHAKTFTMNAGDGSFQLHFYPYYYRVKNIGSNQQWLDTEVFDWGYPVDISNYKNGSWIKIKKTDGSIIYDRILAVSLIFPKTVQFTRLSGAWDSSITSGSEVTPVCVPDTAANPTLTDIDGDGVPDLRFVANTGADAFPPRNGIFTVKVQGSSVPRMLSYRELDASSTVRLLKGVSDPNGGSVAGLTLDTSATNYVELTRFMRVESTGTFGAGSAAVNRKVTYYAPIGYARATPIPKTEFREGFADLSKWFTGSHVSHAGAQSTTTPFGEAVNFGSGVLTRTIAGASYQENQIGLNWSGAGIPLVTEWLRASRYLSYDVQAKIYGSSALTSLSPKSYGVSFRLDESGNAMGLTVGIMKPGLDQFNRDRDGIPDGIIASGSGYTDATDEGVPEDRR
jgi:prepilin-type N-terminal cleavage/methylation domain-containing protein